jgi:DNA-directed RNA polymerase subunit RPC12/RpoP
MNLILNQLKKEAVITCPLCDKQYKPDNIRIVQENEEKMLVYNNCPHCHSGVLSLLYKDLMGITLVGLVTDLSYEDALKLKNTRQINSDDVLKIYKQLNIK